MTSENTLYVEKNKAEVSKNVPELRFQGFIDAWEQRKLGELLTEIKRPIKMQDDDTYQLVTVKRRNEGIVSRGLFKGSQILVKNYFELHAGDYLISKRQVVHGANGIVPKDMEGAIVSNEYLVSVGNKNITTDFLTIISKLPIMYKMFFLSSYGIDIEKLVFNVNDWKKREISIPSLQEQNRISSFFKQLDNALTLHQRKLDRLKLLNQGYLQQLFPKNDEEVPSIRFAYFENKWEQRKLGDLLTKNSKKNKDLNVTNVESVSNKTGFTKQTEQFEDYSVASADLSNYYVITEKQFAYNPSRINVGSIAYKAVGDDKSVVSPLYVSFSTKKLLNDGYLWNWFKTTSFQSQRERLSEGGVRDTLSFNQLSEMSINVPEYFEQEKISSFFKQMDDAIALYQSKLDKLKSIKQSLLQKMFI